MRYIALVLLLIAGCGPKELPVEATPVQAGPLEPGEMAVVIYEDFHDSGFAVLYDGPTVGSQDIDQLTIGSKVLVIAPEDEQEPAEDKWLTVLAGPGVARDYEGRPINRQVRGLVRAAVLARPLPTPPPGTPPPTAP